VALANWPIGQLASFGFSNTNTLARSQEPGGRFVVTFGSCHLDPGANASTSCYAGASTPAVLSYASPDFQRWQYLGEPWRRASSLWPITGFPSPMHVPRTECPYMWQQGGRTFVKVCLIILSKVCHGDSSPTPFRHLGRSPRPAPAGTTSTSATPRTATAHASWRRRRRRRGSCSTGARSTSGSQSTLGS
jgi:hypothetical protein